MKKQLLLLGAAALFSWNVGTAQGSGVSAGLEIAVPTGDFGDFASLGIGLSGQYELGISDNISATANVGYILLIVDDALSDLVKNASMIPIQAGARYYLDEVGSGIHLGVQIGVHSMSITTEDFEILGVTVEGETTSDSNLSFAPTVGFNVSEQLDIAARYQIITSGEDDVDSSSYLGVRVGFKF